jgi:hypothetical protein
LIIDIAKNGEKILKLLDELVHENIVAFGFEGVDTEIVFTACDSNGRGVALVMKNGTVLTDPLEIVTVADEAADKVSMFV